MAKRSAKTAEQPAQKCFVIMPITTPTNTLDRYKNDADHFMHVFEHLFGPALTEAGFEPVPPKSVGSEVIQAEIISLLASSELVLCDMSVLNPNVFFELGVRTALNKPVALVIDDKTKGVPFDTSVINYLQYDSSLHVWNIHEQIRALSKHARDAHAKSKSVNSLWKYFGVSTVGVFDPKESTLADKVDLLLREMAALRQTQSVDQPIYTTGQVWAVQPSTDTLVSIIKNLDQLRKSGRLHPKTEQDLQRALQRAMERTIEGTITSEVKFDDLGTSEAISTDWGENKP